ncbi:MAG: hypothetical protein CO092_01545 [Candidatus Aenigmarchaeota archaeon CG_4_9_14_3_um_filter_37_18]|nr:MAG: hypothetical protein COW21_04885 [Candidatus Aenigmarchaeota archaeon CG15_BIG_FIL_POST_REV_8_21_14_020_37_27]PJB75539.1 MAG: hypothetical protein CO092_01545 [Candidatus Aenigmarchaeota archaeon CG_4_9_14_3_um_filter_37_18]
MLKNVKNEKSASEMVREEIDGMPYVRAALEMGLLNYSAFARLLTLKIKEKYNKKASKESVIVAAIRYQKDMVRDKLSEKLKIGISECTLSMRSDIIDLTLQRSLDTQQIINNFSKEVDWKSGEIMFVVQGRGEVEIILDRLNYKKISEMVSEESVVETISNLSIISVHQPNTNLTFIPGFYGFLLNSLAMSNINVIEVMSTLTELIIVVSQEQASRSYEKLSEIIKKFRC